MRNTTRSSSAPGSRSASSRACCPSAANGCCTSTATSTTVANRPPSRPSRICSGKWLLRFLFPFLHPNQFREPSFLARKCQATRGDLQETPASSSVSLQRFSLSIYVSTAVALPSPPPPPLVTQAGNHRQLDVIRIPIREFPSPIKVSLAGRLSPWIEREREREMTRRRSRRRREKKRERERRYVPSREERTKSSEYCVVTGGRGNKRERGRDIDSRARISAARANRRRKRSSRFATDRTRCRDALYGFYSRVKCKSYTYVRKLFIILLFLIQILF